VTDRAEPISVLAVDDSAEFLAAVCAWIESQPELKLHGTATNGREALEALHGGQPDLVLMDAMMPELDGFEATRRIKMRPDAPPVVMLSVHNSSAVENEAWAAGADSFVSKAEFTKLLPGVIHSLLAAAPDRHDGRPGGRTRPKSGGTPTTEIDSPSPRNPEGPVEQRTTERPGRLHVFFQALRARFFIVGSARRPGVVFAGSFLTEGGDR
jgi:CheY-like chemotaxis protein